MDQKTDYLPYIERVLDPILVLRLDTDKNMEEIYIAPKSRIRNYLQKEHSYIKVKPRRNKKNNTDKIYDHFKYAFQGYHITSDFLQPPKIHFYENEIIYKAIRPLGSFMLDFFSMPDKKDFDSLRQNLQAIPTDEQYNDCIDMLRDLYCCENPICKYLSLKFRELYEEEVLKYTDSVECISECNTGISRTVSKIMNQSFYNYVEISKKPQKILWPIIENEPSENWSLKFQEEYIAAYENFVNVILLPGNDKKLCFATTESVLPLVAYYIQVLYNEKRRLRTCVSCGKRFLAPDLNKTKFCSKNCQEEGKKKSRKIYNTKYDEKKFMIYNGKRAYWTYRLRKVRESGSEDAIREADAAYKAFNIAARKWLTSSEKSVDIFFEHEKIIDGILEKYNISVKGR